MTLPNIYYRNLIICATSDADKDFNINGDFPKFNYSAGMYRLDLSSGCRVSMSAEYLGKLMEALNTDVDDGHLESDSVEECDLAERVEKLEQYVFGINNVQ